MNPTLSLESLADKIVRLEKEVIILRRQLAQLNQRVELVGQFPNVPHALGVSWSEKEQQKTWMNELFAHWGIQATPLGAKQLQQKMGTSGLGGNELSTSLVEAREQ